jgi:hypothetical protein
MRRSSTASSCTWKAWHVSAQSSDEAVPTHQYANANTQLRLINNLLVSAYRASSFHHLVNALVQHLQLAAGTGPSLLDSSHSSISKDNLLMCGNGDMSAMKDTYVWLDIFAVNQHPGKTQDDDLSKLQDVIFQADKTLLVMDDQVSFIAAVISQWL